MFGEGAQVAAASVEGAGPSVAAVVPPLETHPILKPLEEQYEHVTKSQETVNAKANKVQFMQILLLSILYISACCVSKIPTSITGAAGAEEDTSTRAQMPGRTPASTGCLAPFKPKIGSGLSCKPI